MASLTFVENATSAGAIHAQLSVSDFAKVVAPTVGGFAADLALQTVPIDAVAAGCAQHLMLTPGTARARRDLGIGDPGHVSAPNPTRLEPYAEPPVVSMVRRYVPHDRGPEFVPRVTALPSHSLLRDDWV